MKAKKKLFIIAGVVGLAALILCGLFLLGRGGGSQSEDWLTEYKRLAETRTGLIERMEVMPYDESLIPVDGVDYSSQGVRAAFDELYALPAYDDDVPAYSVTVRNAENEIYVVGGKSQSGSKPGGRGPVVWVDMGEAITSRIIEQNERFGDTDLYAEFSEPLFWVVAGDVFTKQSRDELEETGEPFDAAAYIEYVTLSITLYAEEAIPDEDFSFLGEVVAECMAEDLSAAEYADGWDAYIEEYFDSSWDDYREEPVIANIPEPEANPQSDSPLEITNQAGLIKAEHYPVSYKSVGRLFCRETLNEKEQLAYDILATAVQRGIFEVECDFGLDIDGMGNAATAISRDFPEFFYLRSWMQRDENGTVIEFIFTIDETIKKIGIDKAIAQVNAAANPVVAKAKELEKPIDRVKYIVDYLCEVNTFPSDSEEKIAEGQTIWSGIVTHSPVCAGYSAAFQYYMNRLDIPAALMVLPGVHQWNLLELEGDYYYMDVTWVDGLVTKRGSERKVWEWFNFNEKLRDEMEPYAPDEQIHTRSRDEMSAAMPAANGTKFTYENWFGPVDGPEPTPYVPPAASVTVVINGTDVSSRLNVRDVDGVLYAEGKSFVEAFADRGASKKSRWFNYEYSAKELEVYITNNSDGEKTFTLYLNADVMRWHSLEGDENLEMSAKVRDYAKDAYIPMLAFAENLGKAGYDVEIVIDGKKHTFKAETTPAPNNEEPLETAKPSEPVQTDNTPAPQPSSSDPQGYNIPEIWESLALVDNWSEGPTSLWEPMEEAEVISGIIGTYAGYYQGESYQTILVFNEDGINGYREGLDPEWPDSHRFEYKLLFDFNHPMVDNTYNAVIQTRCIEEGHEDSYEFVVVSPTVLYQPAMEVIFYKVE
jgi:hypothetical protein